jgi:hypothetical protein
MTEPNNSANDNEALLSRLNRELDEVSRMIDAMIESGHWKEWPLTPVEKRNLYRELELSTNEQRRALSAARHLKWKCYSNRERGMVGSAFLRECESGDGLTGKFLRTLAGAVDVLNGKDGGKDFPLPSQARVIRAYAEALRKNCPPLIVEVKTEYKNLFGEHSLPADWTIRKTLRDFGYPLREAKPGRPTGVKDSEKRKRRSRHKKKLPRPSTKNRGKR